MELVELDFNRTAQALGRTGWERGSHLFASTDPEENETGIEGGADAGLTVGPSGSGPGRGGCERALRPSRLRRSATGRPGAHGRAGRLGSAVAACAGKMRPSTQLRRWGRCPSG